MSLIRVLVDAGLEKHVYLIARIVRTQGTVFTIQFLSPTDEHTKHDQTIYKYEDETYDIEDDSISHYYDTSNESDIGYKQVDVGAWVKFDDIDEDYSPSEEEDDDEQEEELEEEFNEEFEEEEHEYDDEDDD